LQLDRAARGRVPAKSTVLVRETEDGRVRVIHVGRDGRERVCAWTPAVARVVARPPLSGPPVNAPLPIADAAPAPNHPWRGQHQRWVDAAMRRKASLTPHP